MHMKPAKYNAYEGGDDQKLYFFTPRQKKYPKGHRPRRDAGDGVWKASETDVEIKKPNTEDVIGRKRKLVFNKGKAADREKTNWIMDEYTTYQGPAHVRIDETDMTLDKCILVVIYKKKNKKKATEEESDNHVSPQEQNARGDVAILDTFIEDTNNLINEFVQSPFLGCEGLYPLPDIANANGATLNVGHGIDEYAMQTPLAMHPVGNYQTGHLPIQHAGNSVWLPAIDYRYIPCRYACWT